MSGAYCAVPGCGNKQYKTINTNPEIKYYYFPKVDSIRRKKWLKFCNKPPKFKGYVCSTHFKEEDFQTAPNDVIDDVNFKRRLLPHAVPTRRLTRNDDYVTTIIEENDDDDDLSTSLVERLSSALEAPTQPAEVVKECKMDSDGFRLEFDPDIPEDERNFYMKKYPTVNKVWERRIHCTVCDEHIGTAPAQESIIRMHPILKVTHCKKCHEFYNSGEFSKGEDGSELYCRWCGQGGQVYCCAKCPYVFCRNCIVNNLTKGCVRDIEENENWNCFSCAPKIMWHLRAQHWGLMNFIEKQKQAILSENHAESEIKRLMTRDLTVCCKRRPNSAASGGNVSEDSSDSELSLSEIRKRSLNENPMHTPTSPIPKIVRKILPKADLNSTNVKNEQPEAKRMKLNNDEVVCTPDVLSMLQTTNNPVQKKMSDSVNQLVRNQKDIQQQRHEFQQQTQLTQQRQQQRHPQLLQQQLQQQNQHQTQHIQPQQHVLQIQTPTMQTVQGSNQQPPPLIIRNFNSQLRAVTPSVVARKTIVGARPPSATPGQSPVYHTINGFRIDLNSAAQQETFRLPNGKLIQVKKQGTTTGPVNPSQNNVIASNAQQMGIANQVIRTQLSPRPVPNLSPQASVNSQTISQPGIQHYSISQPQLATIRYASATAPTITNSTTITTPSGTVIGQLLNGATNATVAQLTSRPTPIPTLVRQFFSATPLGQARTQLQNQIFSGMDICQHLTGKIHTLTNSNAYKSVASYTDVKELYIHLSYLFTYAIGRFKTLQEKCMEDMRRLGFAGDAACLESGQIAGEKYASDGDDDDIEIVEPKTTLIDLDSDEEETAPAPKTPTITTSSPIAEKEPSKEPEVDVSLLSGLLEVELVEGNEPAMQQPELISETFSGPIAETSLSSIAETSLPPTSETSLGPMAETSLIPKKPRKKTTNKPNPHLIKQQEMQQREKELEEQKKQHDPKLKSPCQIVLDRVEDVNQEAKTLLEEHIATVRVYTNKNKDGHSENMNLENESELLDNEEASLSVHDNENKTAENTDSDSEDVQEVLKVMEDTVYEEETNVNEEEKNRPLNNVVTVQDGNETSPDVFTEKPSEVPHVPSPELQQPRSLTEQLRISIEYNSSEPLSSEQSVEENVGSEDAVGQNAPIQHLVPQNVSVQNLVTHDVSENRFTQNNRPVENPLVQNVSIEHPVALNMPVKSQYASIENLIAENVSSVESPVAQHASVVNPMMQYAHAPVKNLGVVDVSVQNPVAQYASVENLVSHNFSAAKSEVQNIGVDQFESIDSKDKVEDESSQSSSRLDGVSNTKESNSQVLINQGLQRNLTADSFKGINDPEEMEVESCSNDGNENCDQSVYSEREETSDGYNMETNEDNDESSQKERRISIDSESSTSDTSQEQSRNSQQQINAPAMSTQQEINGDRGRFSEINKIEENSLSKDSIDKEEDSNSKSSKDTEDDNETIESSTTDDKKNDTYKIGIEDLISQGMDFNDGMDSLDGDVPFD